MSVASLGASRAPVIETCIADPVRSAISIDDTRYDVLVVQYQISCDTFGEEGGTTPEEYDINTIAVVYIVVQAVGARVELTTV